MVSPWDTLQTPNSKIAAIWVNLAAEPDAAAKVARQFNINEDEVVRLHALARKVSEGRWHAIHGGNWTARGHGGMICPIRRTIAYTNINRYIFLDCFAGYA